MILSFTDKWKQKKFLNSQNMVSINPSPEGWRIKMINGDFFIIDDNERLRVVAILSRGER